MNLADQIDKKLDYQRWFKNEYYRLHECCPDCGSEHAVQTLLGYIIIPGKEDEFKDLNESRCSECGSVHTVHERVPKE